MGKGAGAAGKGKPLQGEGDAALRASKSGQTKVLGAVKRRLCTNNVPSSGWRARRVG